MNDVLCNGIPLWTFTSNASPLSEIFINRNIGKCREPISMARLAMLDPSSGGYLSFAIKDLRFHHGVGFMSI